jgi:hypothetical protein
MSPLLPGRPALRSALPSGCADTRTHAAILAASLVVAVLLVGGGLWLALEQAHPRNGVETDLTELARLQGSARWAEARAALWRAETWYQGGGPDDLRLRIAQARRDLNLVIKLDAIRLERATRGELAFYFSVLAIGLILV